MCVTVGVGHGKWKGSVVATKRIRASGTSREAPEGTVDVAGSADFFAGRADWSPRETRLLNLLSDRTILPRGATTSHRVSGWDLNTLRGI